MLFLSIVNSVQNGPSRLQILGDKARFDATSAFQVPKRASRWIDYSRPCRLSCLDSSPSHHANKHSLIPRLSLFFCLIPDKSRGRRQKSNQKKNQEKNMLPPTCPRTPAFFSGHRTCFVATAQLIVKWLSSLKERTASKNVLLVDRNTR